MTPTPLARLATALAAALAALAALPCFAAPADLQRTVDAAVHPLLHKYGVPGIAVAVTAHGQAAFFNYGVAARDSRTPVSERTLFELGSISKTFTATLACLAQGEGRLALDDHPGAYLPQLKDSALDRATLLEFGTYTAAGLPLQVPDGIETDARLLAWLRAWRPDAAPGARRLYSNPSIGVLGRAAAQALRMEYADAIERRVLPGLGLAHTFIRVRAAALPDYAWGEDAAGKPRRVHPGPFGDETYGVKSSAADMIRYVQANIDPDGLAAPLRQAIACTHVGYFDAGAMVQGLGWEQYPYPVTQARLLDGNSGRMGGESVPVTRLAAPRPAPPATLFNKTGSTAGFGAYAAFVPGQRIGVVILANQALPIAARVQAAYAILGALDAQRQDRR